METDGILLLNKEFGLTSFEAVSRVKKILGTSKAGHAGTLDPYATGLLILALGRATKIAGYLSRSDKTYLARIRLGQTRDTFDRFGGITGESGIIVRLHEIESVLESFRGDFSQIIPAFSAIHYQGKRLYELARKGQATPLRYKTVKINKLDLIEYNFPYLMLEIGCSSGTYIRSLAHQLGQELGCGAHLYSLVRTTVGDYRLADTITLLQLEALVKLGLIGEYIIPIERALKLPALIIDDHKRDGIKDGQDVLGGDIDHTENDFAEGDLVGLKDKSGSFLAIGLACISSQEMNQPAVGRRKIFEYKRVI
jgi:tRNA pseudouridine55 synthase